MKFDAVVFLLVSCYNSMAQSTAGITNQPDTSFTTYSAYAKAVKKYPAIQIVNEFQLPGVTEKKDIVYCKAGQRELMLDVFYPAVKDSAASTAILIFHGGGWRSGNKRQHHPLAQKLASLGYTCITPEYRLSTEALYPAAIFDAKAAVRWVKLNAGVYNIDTNKIVALGFSAGAQMASYLGTTGGNIVWGEDCNSSAGDAVQAIINIDGILSFVHRESGEGDDSKKTSAATYWFGYAKKEYPVLWEEASPLKWVSKQTPPALFINSAEKRMHAGQADFIKVLNENNIYSEVHAFENAPHTFCLFHPWFEPTVEYIDGFLKKIFGR
jgi:acetyl esterase/lipase